MDERLEASSDWQQRPEPQSVPLQGEPEAQPSPAPTAEPQAAAPESSDEATLRILGMVERHEISASEGATLLAALRR